MELAFLTLLLKDGANSVGGGVAIENKWVLETRLAEDWSRTDGIYECLEGGLVFILPVEAATFRTEGDKGVQRGS